MSASINDELQIKDAVNTFIENEFGSDISKLKKATVLYKDLLKTKESLEKQLSLASTEVPSQIQTAVLEAESATYRIVELGTQQDALFHSTQDHIREMQPLINDTTEMTDRIKELERYSMYLLCLDRIEELSSSVQSALLTDSMQHAVDAFKEMTDTYLSLCRSNCLNLLSYIRETIRFWYKILKDKIASEYEAVLKTLKWPMVASTILAPSVQKPAESHSHMETLFKQLLQLNLPKQLVPSTQPLPSCLVHLGDVKPQLLPLQLMIKPLRKRFKYHFYGKRQTNSLGKPEWYFTQVLSWIREHSQFLDKYIQPLLQEAGVLEVDAGVEFMRALVLLVVEKMSSDLPEIMYDEQMFAHLVEETLSFDQELRNGCGYPAQELGCLHVLTEVPFAFQKWLIIENKFAVEKIESMLASSSAWHSQYKDIADVDELRVPECGESFMTLMLTITDRYKHLPDPAHRLRFVGLQLELLDDFRIRLVQIMKEESHQPLGQCYCAILNTVHYITDVLHEWTELVFFLQLQQFKQDKSSKKFKDLHQNNTVSAEKSKSIDVSNLSLSENIGEIMAGDNDAKLLTVDCSLFDEIIDLFEGMKMDMLNRIVNHVFLDVKARSQPYRKDRWISLPIQKDTVTLGLSSSACEMMSVLKEHLRNVDTCISKPLFTNFWQQLVDKLNQFLMEELVLCNKFNDGGAAQLHFDMTRNLLPLFGDFTTKPESYFRDVHEACILLTLSTGSAILLNEILHSVLHETTTDSNAKTNPYEALHELGVFQLTPEMAENVLKLRTSLTI